MVSVLLISCAYRGAIRPRELLRFREVCEHVVAEAARHDVFLRSAMSVPMVRGAMRRTSRPAAVRRSEQFGCSFGSGAACLRSSASLSTRIVTHSTPARTRCLRCPRRRRPTRAGNPQPCRRAGEHGVEAFADRQPVINVLVCRELDRRAGNAAERQAPDLLALRRERGPHDRDRCVPAMERDQAPMFTTIKPAGGLKPEHATR